MEGIKEESRVLITRENVGDVVKGDSILVEKLSDYESKGFGYSEIVGIVQVVESNYMDVYYTPITLVGKLFPYIFEEDGAICYKIITPDIKESNFSDVEKRKESLISDAKLPQLGIECLIEYNENVWKSFVLLCDGDSEMFCKVDGKEVLVSKSGRLKFKAIDSRTTKEKIRDALVEVVEDGYTTSLEARKEICETVDKIISCGKITITLNKED